MTIRTKTIDRNKPNDLKAIIDEYDVLTLRVQIVNPGAFSFNYEVYVVKTPLADAKVIRRYSAFTELRELLLKLFPGYIVPPVPKKPIKKFKPKYMNKRKGKLQLFLDDLVDHPLLGQTTPVWEFLTIVDEKAYEKGKEKYTIPKDIAEYITLEGVAKITFDEELDKACIDTETMIKAINEEFKT